MSETPTYKKRYVHINSKNRRNKTEDENNFLVYLGDDFQNVARVVVRDIVIPHTFYNISDELLNNELIIEVLTGLTQYTSVIPNGNYSFADLKTFIEADLLAQEGSIWTLTFNVLTGKLNLAVAGGETFEIIQSSSLNVMGFEPDAVKAVNKTATNIFNVLADAGEIFLECSFLDTEHIYTNANNENFPYLYHAHVSGFFGDTIHIESSDNQINSFEPLRLFNMSQFRAVLRFGNDNRTPVNLNGAHWGVTLVCLLNDSEHFERIRTLNGNN